MPGAPGALGAPGAPGAAGAPGALLGVPGMEGPAGNSAPHWGHVVMLGSQECPHSVHFLLSSTAVGLKHIV